MTIDDGSWPSIRHARQARTPRRHVARAAIGAAVILLTATACTESRDYTVPDAACGVTVGADVLSPFLPRGENLTQRTYDAGPESPRCRLSVDNKLIVYISGDVVPEDTDPIKVQDRALVRLGSPATVDIGDDARVADNGAMAVAACTYEGDQRKFVVLIQLEREIPEKTSERRDALQSVLRSYFPKAMEKQGCE
ncbi:hypothetical protein GCM10010307_69110 [Streptomyces vastus]|uniref:DUF3558 domain-containing protein n=1 Tax=Streptomyces vastus TaxID=285451 RepID=A0ABN3RMQ0_9ACTN